MSASAEFRRAFFSEYETRCQSQPGEIAYVLAKLAGGEAAAKAMALPATAIPTISDAARADLKSAGVAADEVGMLVTRQEAPTAYFSRGIVHKLVIYDMDYPDTKHVLHNVSAFKTVESLLKDTGLFTKGPYGISVEPISKPDDDCTLRPVFIANDEMRVGHCIHTAAHPLPTMGGIVCHLLNTRHGDAQDVPELAICVGYDEDYVSDDDDDDCTPPSSPGNKRSSGSSSPKGKKSRPSDE